ncbi:6-phosphofructokinase [Akkermansiaceae bacterium]|nr:6-phosphofructokinase [Akkermansiaceae bacterium]MDB4288261.1 6-phosphofructokinase [bacterium]MDB4273557.1 6-phosphofructokinase [Akkermansiaceae bacterium]MDB4332290.1 6-phosphofructokinase [Akkermansiaceae bacterium]MDB4525814.1 6-phosphofructokinase [Akkermansiaceae bacterium]
MSEKVAIMTSGGDAAGMNPAIKSAADYAEKCGLTPYVVEWGLRGLIEGWIHKATREKLSGILHRGGTVLGSSRSKRFFDYAFRKQAYENLQKEGITKLIVVGGDGSFSALNQFYADFGVPFAGIPATIDNDIPGTDYCLGVDTALNMIRQSVDSIRDTAASFSRAFVIETMGRHCGYLAMTSALANGADVCLVPEVPYDLDSIAERLRVNKENGQRYILGIVAEGTGMGETLTRWMGDALGMDARLTVLGHVQRGGSPTVYDRIMAHKFAVAAIDGLIAGDQSRVIVFKDGVFGSKAITKIVDTQHRVDADLLKLSSDLSF